MSRLDDAISEVSYILDSLRALREIYETGKDCNTCAKRKSCRYVPRPGQQVRWNCPLWEEEKLFKNYNGTHSYETKTMRNVNHE